MGCLVPQEVNSSIAPGNPALCKWGVRSNRDFSDRPIGPRRSIHNIDRTAQIGYWFWIVVCHIMRGMWHTKEPKLSQFFGGDRRFTSATRGYSRCAAVFLTFAVSLCCGATASPLKTETSVWEARTPVIDGTSPYFGEVLANGVIGIVSSARPFGVERIMLNGAYYRLQPEHRPDGLGNFVVPAPALNPIGLQLRVDGQWIRKLAQVSNFTQTLNLQRAVLATSFEIADKATVSYTIRALRHLPFTALLDVHITAHKTVNLHIAAAESSAHGEGALGDIQDKDRVLVHKPSYAIRMDDKTILLSSAADISPAQISLASCSVFMFGSDDSEQVTENTDADVLGNGSISFNKALNAGETYEFALVGSTTTSRHFEDPVTAASQMTLFAAFQKGGISSLIKKHEAAWAELWQGNIVVEGDPNVQRDVNAMLYHLYSFGREGTRYSISPMGLAGTRYQNIVWMDSDVYIMPPLLILHPDIAKSMLEYRFDHLAAAQHNALAYGYKGAMFPFVGDESGQEAFGGQPYWGQYVTAMVGVAAWNYYSVTQDREWLRTRGYPILSETADFWASRVERNGPGRFEISHIIDNDESTGLVDNGVVTNAAARENLADATAAARVLAEKGNPDWEVVRRNIPTERLKNGVLADYKGGPEAGLMGLHLSVLLHQIRDRDDILRQIASASKGAPFTPEVAADVPPGMHFDLAVLYARLGKPRESYEAFKKSYVPVIRMPFGTVLGESPGVSQSYDVWDDAREGSYFATGAGGSLQALIFGLGRLEITSTGVVKHQLSLPAEIKTIRVNAPFIHIRQTQ
jgi:hypothetical protein